MPAEYFLLTFTLPAEFRALSWAHQSVVYALLMQGCWETVRTFSQNDKQLQGTPGAIAAAALDGQRRQWRTQRRGKTKVGYLFNHKALAKVFRAKMLAAIEAAGLTLPRSYSEKWVVDCKSVASGEKALIYLALSLSRRHRREGYRRLRQGSGELPLSKRQDRED